MNDTEVPTEPPAQQTEGDTRQLTFQQFQVLLAYRSDWDWILNHGRMVLMRVENEGKVDWQMMRGLTPASPFDCLAEHVMLFGDIAEVAASHQFTVEDVETLLRDVHVYQPDFYAYRSGHLPIRPLVLQEDASRPSRSHIESCEMCTRVWNTPAAVGWEDGWYEHVFVPHVRRCAYCGLVKFGIHAESWQKFLKVVEEDRDDRRGRDLGWVAAYRADIEEQELRWNTRRGHASSSSAGSNLSCDANEPGHSPDCIDSPSPSWTPAQAKALYEDEKHFMRFGRPAYTKNGLARALGIPERTFYSWLHTGRIRLGYRQAHDQRLRPNGGRS